MQHCEQIWADCYQSCEGGGGGGGGGGTDELCDLALNICENTGRDFVETPDGQIVSCDEVRQHCLGPIDPGQPTLPDECSICEDMSNLCPEGSAGNPECQEREEFCVQICGC